MSEAETTGAKNDEHRKEALKCVIDGITLNIRSCVGCPMAPSQFEMECRHPYFILHPEKEKAICDMEIPENCPLRMKAVNTAKSQTKTCVCPVCGSTVEVEMNGTAAVDENILKPCPCCGKPPAVREETCHWDENLNGCTIECENPDCCASPHVAYGFMSKGDFVATRKNAIMEWNRLCDKSEESTEKLMELSIKKQATNMRNA